MRRAVVRAQAIGEAKTLRDSASQVSRATLGLRDMLLRGALRPGQRIAEIPLSAKLGVSRTPLRLAFERLEHEGLIKALPHTGFAASEFSISDIWDAIETRGILEGAAARLAAERLTNPAQLEPLRKINRAMEEISDINLESFTRYLDLNKAFHDAILDLANNQILRRAIEQVYRLPFASPSSRVLLPKTLPGSREILPDRGRASPGAHRRHRTPGGSARGKPGPRTCQVDAKKSGRSSGGPDILETIPGARLIKVRSAERN